VSCTSATVCTECEDPTNRLTPSCECEGHTYDNGVAECAECEDKCKECEIYSYECTVCDDSRVDETPDCPCPDG